MTTTALQWRFFPRWSSYGIVGSDGSEFQSIGQSAMHCTSLYVSELLSIGRNCGSLLLNQLCEHLNYSKLCVRVYEFGTPFQAVSVCKLFGCSLVLYEDRKKLLEG